MPQTFKVFELVQVYFNDKKILFGAGICNDSALQLKGIV